MRRPARLEKPSLEVQADVADALAVDLEVLVVVRVGLAGDVGAAIAADDGERRRESELELGGPGMDAERADQGRSDDVVDRVRVAVPVEIQHPVAPVERAQTERQLSVAERLRCVDGQVATRIHRGTERIEIDVSGDLLRSRRRCTKHREA
jgi:hypothetical protein